MTTPQRSSQAGGKTLAEYEAGKQVVAQSGCLACHKIGENGNDGPGPHADEHRRAPAAAGDRAHARQPDGADAVVQEPAAGEVQRDRRLPRRSSSSSGRWPPAGHRRRAGTPGGAQVRAMFDRIAGVYDLHEHGHDGRAAPPLARARGRPGARSARATRVLDVATGTGDLALELAGGSRPAARWSAATSPRGCSSARARRRRGGLRRVALRVGRRARRCPTPTTRFDAATVGFGARNFSDLARGLARDGARRAARRAGRGARDHDAARGRRCRRSSACGSTASCRCSGGSPATRRATRTCRTR